MRQLEGVKPRAAGSGQTAGCWWSHLIRPPPRDDCINQRVDPFGTPPPYALPPSPFAFPSQGHGANPSPIHEGKRLEVTAETARRS